MALAIRPAGARRKIRTHTFGKVRISGFARDPHKDVNARHNVAFPDSKNYTAIHVTIGVEIESKQLLGRTENLDHAQAE